MRATRKEVSQDTREDNPEVGGNAIPVALPKPPTARELPERFLPSTTVSTHLLACRVVLPAVSR